MPRWKGKKVSRKRFKELRNNAENRRVFEHERYGFTYKRKPEVIGGNKNSIVNKIDIIYK